jgi:hypothetical protein
MADRSGTGDPKAWQEECVRLVRQRVPDVSVRDARICAEEMHRVWADLPPAEAVKHYFERPQFAQTDWSVFKLD